MGTEALYRLMMWSSPSFPVGAFSYSHGIEYAVEAGLVFDRRTLRDWTKSIIRDGTGRVDAVLFCAAYRCVLGDRGGDCDDYLGIVELASAMNGTSELAHETRSQGRAFLDAARTAWPSETLAGWVRQTECRGLTPTLPIAVATVSAVQAVPLESCLTAYLHAFAANLISAGVRLIPLGQTDALSALAGIERAVTVAVREGMSCPLRDIGAATPMVDWTSMRHETQYTRLFRS